MGFIDTLKERAKANVKTIVLPETEDKRTLAATEKILKEGIKIDEILYSPLMRAADTAKHISEVTGIPAREELRLKEQNFGKYESTGCNICHIRNDGGISYNWYMVGEPQALMC